jgi:membrane fusion protein (multidrug efflux system)
MLKGSHAPRGRHMHGKPMLRRHASKSLIMVMLAIGTACQKKEPPPPPPPEIPVVSPIQRDQPILLEAIGETMGSVDIPIRARVEGYLEGLFFEEGRPVEKDQLLYTIDPQPFEAAVVEASGQLAEARTMLAKAKSDLDRIRPLAEMKAVSEQDLDGAVAEYEAAIGAVQAAEARVEQKEIELGYTRIHAPIDGRIGLSAAKVGEFVGRAPNPVILNYVSQTDPVRVRFSIDERQYLEFARKFIELRTETVDVEELRAARGKQTPLELILSDGTVHDQPGFIVAYDAAVNPTTGTFRMEADFPNPDNVVLAGQFARVRGVTETIEDAILVPQRAIQERQGLFSVFVVQDDETVELRPVDPGYKVDQLQIINSGLDADEQVVFEGVQRLREGMKIVPVPVQLDDEGAAVEDAPAAEG